MLKTAILTTILFSALSLFCQTPLTDSLQRELTRNDMTDSSRIKILGDLCWYYRNISMDSAFIFGNKGLELSKKTANKNGIAQSYNDIGILHYSQANYDLALGHYRRSLDIRSEALDTLGLASLYNKMGISYQRLFKMDSALYYNIKALEIYEHKKLIKYTAVIKNNNANIYTKLLQYDKALKEHIEVAKIRQDINDTRGLTNSYTNIGNSYLFLKDTIRSLEYYNEGILLAESNADDRSLSTLYNNYGSVLENKSNNKEALLYYKKALKIRNKINDNYGIASTSFNMGTIYMQQGFLKEANKNLNLALEMAKKSKATEIELNTYKSLSLLNTNRGNKEKAGYFFNKFHSLSDSIFSTQVSDRIAEMKEKYESEKRDKEIAQQKEQILTGKLKIKNKNFFNLILISGLGLLSLLSFIIYKKNQQKRIQLQKDMEYQKSISIIKTQNKLQHQRLRISRDLHDNIGSQLTFIISSVDNLKYFSKEMDQKLKDRLKGISSFSKETISQLRDTIWALNKDHISISELKTRIVNLIGKAKSSMPDIEFNLNSDIKTNHELSSLIGMNLFRVTQEALNNSIKYSGASKVEIEILATDNLVNINLLDNGTGFDIRQNTAGNGLKNMQKRIDEISGALNIASTAAYGTSVQMILDINTTDDV